MKKLKDWLCLKSPKTNPLRFASIDSRITLKESQYTPERGTHFDVRIATVDDVSDILMIEKSCYRGETPWNRSALVREIQYNRNAFYMIVHDSDRPIAFLGSWFVSNEAHITNIATIPEYERLGIATFLIKQLKHIIKEENIRVLSLEVRVSNQKAQNLYRKLGFKAGRIKQGYYANDHEDALEMKLTVEETVEECGKNVQASK